MVEVSSKSMENVFEIKKKDSFAVILKKLIRHTLLIIFCLIMAFPFLWMFFSAIKTKSEIWQFPPTLLPAVPQWGNFIDAFKSAPFGLYIFNSTFTSLIIVFIQVINSAMIAYALTNLKFPGKKILFGIIMATYMMPVAATYLPSYVILSKFNMIDTYKGIIISNSVSVFGIFLIRQAFMQIKREMVEAALIDGASHFRILCQIMIPIAKSSFITLALMNFIGNYNNYLWPSLIIKDPNKYLVTMGLRQFFIEGGAYGIKWPQIMAASTFTIAPLLIVFFITQKWFMSGISDTGVKG